MNDIFDSLSVIIFNYKYYFFFPSFFNRLRNFYHENLIAADQGLAAWRSHTMWETFLRCQRQTLKCRALKMEETPFVGRRCNRDVIGSTCGHDFAKNSRWTVEFFRNDEALREIRFEPSFRTRSNSETGRVNQTEKETLKLWLLRSK